MKGFYIIFQLTIFVILLANAFGVVLLGNMLNSLPFSLQFSILGFILIIEFFIITSIVKYFFHQPIVNLENTIKNFLVGNLKNSKLSFSRTPNPNLNYVLAFFGKTLNTLKSIKSEFIHGKEIKGEVELGKEIQGKILSKKLSTVPSLDIIMKSKPAGEIGGDSYDIIKQEDNYYIYVGDATGHGVGAGFIMMMVNSLVSGFSKIFKNGNIILAKTNEILKPRVKANLLMSMLLVRWNESEKKIFMTGAGHEYLMIYKFKQNKCYKIKSGGVALGMIKDISKLLKERELSFEENDVIVLYSDGITEAINKPKKDGSEQMFGEDLLVKAIETAPNIQHKKYKSARSVFNNITIEVSKFMGYKHTQLDDVTLAVIHYKGKDFDIAHDVSEEIPDEFITEWNW